MLFLHKESEQSIGETGIHCLHLCFLM